MAKKSLIRIETFARIRTHVCMFFMLIQIPLLQTSTVRTKISWCRRWDQYFKWSPWKGPIIYARWKGVTILRIGEIFATLNYSGKHCYSPSTAWALRDQCIQEPMVTIVTRLNLNLCQSCVKFKPTFSRVDSWQNRILYQYPPNLVCRASGLPVPQKIRFS